ncbi:hypothetical protein [Fusobacterium polymorphum]|jgi:hypothetical protein|uniref:hypothetical protein n=1 Tax=Fusobacterium nucleatum subsp. polymorphum TaxID=76857 RepID=UPI003009901A
MQKIEEIENIEEFREEEIVKKSKFKGGLSGEVKEIIEKYEKSAKELGKSFTNVVGSNGIIYVLSWKNENGNLIPLMFPVFDMLKNRKVTENDLKNNDRYVMTSEVLMLQEIIMKSDEIIEKRKGE